MIKYCGRPDGLGNKITELILLEAYAIEKNINVKYYWNNSKYRKDRKYPILLKGKNVEIIPIDDKIAYDIRKKILIMNIYQI